MNYQKIHDNIIANAKSLNRQKGVDYYELHHIIPRAVGGTDDDENLVLLTCKEHFIVHYLLWKIHGTRTYRDPIFMFKSKGASNSRLYEAARLSHIDEMRNNNPSTYLSEEAKKSRSTKLSAYTSNRPAEHNRKISEAKMGIATRTGAVLTEDTKKTISGSLKKYFAENEISAETRAKISAANMGRVTSEETKVILKERARARKKWNCKYCDKVLDGGNLKQHMQKVHKCTAEEIDQWKTSQPPITQKA